MTRRAEWETESDGCITHCGKRAAWRDCDCGGDDCTEVFCVRCGESLPDCADSAVTA